jgi:hypothetical protein
MAIERAPKGLGAEGRRVWKAVVADAGAQGLALDSRELLWLENAANLADRISELEAKLSGSSFVVTGHANQDVAHPLIAEIRMHRALLATTLARIRVDLPESESQSLGGSAVSATISGRKGANVKWRGRYA